MPTAPTHPLVSVVMPAYNAQTYIGASITGVLTQTHPNVELIVVDDGSTDRTAAIVAAYGDAVRYVHQDNAGSSAARNRGLQEARGEFVALCDADDVYAPRFLEAMLEAYRAAGGGRRFVMTDAIILTETGVSHGRRLVGRRFPAPARQRLAVLQQNFVPYFTLMPRAMAQELEGFSPQVKYNEDWDFYVRALLAGWEAVYQDVPLMEYRWTPGSKSTESDRTSDAAAQILGRVAERDDLRPEERAYVETALEHGCPRQFEARASAAMRAGRPQEAREAYRRLLALDPLDRRLRTKARLLGGVPGAARLWALRLRRIDAAMGRSADDHR